MTFDLFQNPDDKVETDPPQLGPLFVAVLSSGLSKELAEAHQKPWTQQLETDLQGRIAALVAQCKAKGLASFKIIVTRPNGAKVTRDMDVAKIARTRSLN